MKQPNALTMESSVRQIHGVGEKIAAHMEAAGICSVKDLLFYLPRRYDRYEMPEESALRAYRDAIGVTERMDLLKSGSDSDAAVSEESPFTVLKVRLISKPTLFRAKKMEIINVTAETPSKERVQLRWFRMPYLLKTLWEGKELILRGHLSIRKDGTFFMEHPSMYEETAYRKLTKTLQPVYPATSSLPAGTIRRIIENAFQKDGIRERIVEDKTEEFLEEYQFPSLAEALTAIHFPEDGKSLERAHKRLAFEEFYAFLENVWELKKKKENSRNLYQISYPIRLERVIEELPYSLTDGQLTAVKEILSDLASEHMMNRLLQGDVGSGKTIVAFLTMSAVTMEGYQCALMAPTEVLARQHYEKLLAFDEKYHLNLAPVLLVGSMSASHKAREVEKIANGTYHTVVGTHALFQEKVRFDRLAYCITDEQHRFGVRQREELASKGLDPHILVMSATPIPRSLALILYADMDLTVMDQVPAARKPIMNCVIRPAGRLKAYGFMKTQLKEGHQGIVICSMISDTEDGSDYQNVTDYSERLRRAFSKDGYRVEMLHGQMKAEEKNRIMEEFAAGNIHILVSTTVIEVGIDVPNATVILIEDAGRFGLAQLHQLRGRVGRSSYQSYCIMVDTGRGRETNERLQIMNKSNDGFFIAKEDLRLRGPGDFFGIRQSGALGFMIADLYQDHDMLELAQKIWRRKHEEP